MPNPLRATHNPQRTTRYAQPATRNPQLATRNSLSLPSGTIAGSVCKAFVTCPFPRHPLGSSILTAMLAEVVFVTRFLGIATGTQPVKLEGDSTIRSIELLQDDVKIATITRPPWSAVVDFGSEIKPQELTAVAFDEQRHEVGRDTQTVNLPRPIAEISLLLNRKEDHLSARVEWIHIGAQAPVSFTAALDGKIIQKSKSVVAAFAIPAVDGHEIHSLSVEIVFADQTRARKEIVFGGIYTEEVPAELSPIALRVEGKQPIPAGCFELHGAAIEPRAIDDERARAFFITAGTGGIGRHRLEEPRLSDARFRLARTDLTLVASSARRVQAYSGRQTDLFETTYVRDGVGIRGMLVKSTQPSGPVRAADAVAGAGVHALGDGRRRVVVLVIGGSVERDVSMHSPKGVRRYLERIGVPLRVWSLDGPRPDLEAEWGPVQDVSSIAYLARATQDLAKELDSQRIAWMPATPFDAIHVRAVADCAVTPLAKD